MASPDDKVPKGITPAVAKRVGAATQQVERAYRNRPAQRARYPVGVGSEPLQVAKTDAGGIDAMDGLAPGRSDTVTLYTFDGSVLVAGEAGDEVTVFNAMPGAIAADTFIIVAKVAGGSYFVVAEACP